MTTINKQVEGVSFMNNITKMNIMKPVNELFEAFVDPSKIGNFWFSSSSEDGNKVRRLH